MTSPLRVYPRGMGEPRDDLALEEDLLEAAAAGEPSLLLYAWPQPVLVLGYAQDPSSVDLAACARMGVPVYRRITGGTGVLHHRALSVALALPSEHPWCATIASLYDGFVGAVQAACAAAGFPLERGSGHGAPSRGRSPICFEDTLTESLLLGGRKVFGGAQARRRASCLVHATLLLGLDPELQAAVYGVPGERVRAALGSLPAEARRLEALLPQSFAEGTALSLAPSAPAPSPSAPSRARYDTSRWAPLAID